METPRHTIRASKTVKLLILRNGDQQKLVNCRVLNSRILVIKICFAEIVPRPWYSIPSSILKGQKHLSWLTFLTFNGISDPKGNFLLEFNVLASNIMF